jgi:hypothetical protein
MITFVFNPNINPRGSRVISALNPTAIPMPDFVLGNELQTTIFLADGEGGYDDNSGNPTYSVRTAIGIPGVSMDWVNTNWTTVTGPPRGWFGILATNTDAIADLFVSLDTNPLQCELEITIFDSHGRAVTQLETPIKIWNRITADSDLVVTPSPNNTDGEFAIPSDVDTVLVTGLGLSAVPRRVIVSVRKPALGLNIQGAVVSDTVTTDGFRVDLSGQTDTSTYKLDYYLIF